MRGTRAKRSARAVPLPRLSAAPGTGPGASPHWPRSADPSPSASGGFYFPLPVLFPKTGTRKCTSRQLQILYNLSDYLLRRWREDAWLRFTCPASAAEGALSHARDAASGKACPRPRKSSQPQAQPSSHGQRGPWACSEQQPRQQRPGALALQAAHRAPGERSREVG